MTPKKRTRKAAEKEEDFVCPLCLLFGSARSVTERKSAFLEHMNNARIEVLEAIKALVDERLDTLKKKSASRKSGLTKIKVED